jgi:glycosyltransferase involved in cell wall biosynthesis
MSPGTASDEYFKWVGLKPNQIFRARHAVDNHRFLGNGDQELDDKAKYWRKELGISDDKIVFLFAGKFEPKKNPLLLIKTFKLLLQKRSDIHLIMVGNGILEGQIKKETSNIQFPIPSTQHPSTNSTSNITILPFQNQSLMPIVYRLGDVFVLPSKGPGETWGLAINEAMASGRTVIASDKCGGAKDLIKDCVNGYIFSAEDEHALGLIMGSIELGNAKSMGEKAREFILDFDYSDFANSLESILK